MSAIKEPKEIKFEIDRYRRYMLEHEYTEKTARGYSIYLSRFLRQRTQEESYSLEKSIIGFLSGQRESNPKTYKSLFNIFTASTKPAII